MTVHDTQQRVQKSRSLVTHSLHADIVVNLGGSRHINASLNMFGVTHASVRLLVAKVNATQEDVAMVREVVKGEQVAVPDGSIGNDKRMKKAFKVVAPELQVGNLVDAAICRAAIQDG
jgi:hypothetical protein